MCIFVFEVARNVFIPYQDLMLSQRSMLNHTAFSIRYRDISIMIMEKFYNVYQMQRIESISNFAASIDIFKVFYLTVKHIVIKNRTFSA